MAKKRETAWTVLDSDNQMWRGRGKGGFSNAGMLFKTAGVLKSQLDIIDCYGIPDDAKVVRVRITAGVEEEHSVEDFLDNWRDLDTP
jgi:hypothetical protein